MPGFGSFVQHNISGAKILDLGLKEVVGIGLFTTIEDRDNLSGGEATVSQRCKGYIAIVKDDVGDGTGTARAYIFTGPEQGEFSEEFVTDDDWTNSSYWTEVGGGTGTQGTAGVDGVTYNPVVGTVDPSAPGADPEVTLEYGTTSATEGVATFSFVLPRGDQGPDGPQGATGNDGTTFTPAIGSVDILNPASAGTATVDLGNAVATFSFGIPAPTTISHLEDVSSDPVESSFMYAPAGTTHLEPHSFTGATGVNVVVSGTAITTELDFSELPTAVATGGSALYEILTESNGGRGVEIAAYDPTQGEITVSYYNILTNLANLIVSDAVSNDPNVSLNDYGGTVNPADVDGDGTVGVNDLLDVLSYFGLDAVTNGIIKFFPLNATTLTTANSDLYSIFSFEGYSENTKLYFPIKEQSVPDEYFTLTGGFAISVSGTGLTNGSGYIQFSSGSSVNAPIAASNNANGIIFDNNSIRGVSESGDAVITFGFDYDYQDSNGATIVSGSYEQHSVTVNPEGAVLRPGAPQEIGPLFVDYMVDNHGSDGFSYSDNNTLNVPAFDRVRIKPWMKSNSEDVSIYTSLDGEPSTSSFEAGNFRVIYYRQFTAQ